MIVTQKPHTATRTATRVQTRSQPAFKMSLNVDPFLHAKITMGVAKAIGRDVKNAPPGPDCKITLGEKRGLEIAKTLTKDSSKLVQDCAEVYFSTAGRLGGGLAGIWGGFFLGNDDDD